MVDPKQAFWSECAAIMESAQNEFEAVVRKHSRTVYKVAFAVLRNHHDAEDAAQETFLRFWRSRKHWEEICDHRARLARTAWRLALDRRKKNFEVGLEEAAESLRHLRAQGATPDDIAARDQMTALLARLIASLPEDLRGVLTLSTVEDLNSVQISEVLGIPDGTVRTRLMRLREILREKLLALMEGKHGH